MRREKVREDGVLLLLLVLELLAALVVFDQDEFLLEGAVKSEKSDGDRVEQALEPINLVDDEHEGEHKVEEAELLSVGLIENLKVEDVNVYDGQRAELEHNVIGRVICDAGEDDVEDKQDAAVESQ